MVSPAAIDYHLVWSTVFGTVFDPVHSSEAERAVLAARIAVTNREGRAFWLGQGHSHRERMTKTDAKRAFCLTDADLGGLPCVERFNPRYRSAAPMMLFSVSRLVDAAYAKHGGSVGMWRRRILAQKRSKAARERARAAEQRREKECSEREARLEAALRMRGLELRADSRLCAEFIKGCCRLDMEDVVEEMDEMRFYHTRTTYPREFQRIAETLKACGEWWDRDEVSFDAKWAALWKFRASWNGDLTGIPVGIAARLQRS